MALSQITIGALGVGFLMAPLASTPTTEEIRLRAIASDPAVVAALRAFEASGRESHVNYDTQWEIRLLEFERDASIAP
jgi:hypothetical protein